MGTIVAVFFGGIVVVTALHLIGERLSESGLPWSYGISVVIGLVVSLLIAVLLGAAGSAGDYAAA
jgi:hypothetical protein